MVQHPWNAQAAKPQEQQQRLSESCLDTAKTAEREVVIARRGYHRMARQTPSPPITRRLAVPKFPSKKVVGYAIPFNGIVAYFHALQVRQSPMAN